jgi:hypothetical protein
MTSAPAMFAGTVMGMVTKPPSPVRNPFVEEAATDSLTSRLITRSTASSLAR